jgi:hypothetical protein
MAPDDLDDAFESAAVPDPDAPRARAVITREQFFAMPYRGVPCGYLTLTLTDGGQRRFRIRLERGKYWTGCRTLAISRKFGVPPVPHEEKVEHEWETIALVTTTGIGVLRRWLDQWECRWAAAIWALLTGESVPSGYSLEIEPRCWMTMHELRDDAAKETGLCKTWRKRFGVA